MKDRITKNSLSDLLQSREEIYFSRDEAISIISEIINNNYTVIGIEGFQVVDSSLNPLLDVIADYSMVFSDKWIEYKNKCDAAAYNFVTTVYSTTEIYFTLVVLSKEEFNIINNNE